MISLLPLQKILTWVSVIYAAFVVTVGVLLNATGIDAVSIAFKVSALLNLFIFCVAAFGWRCLWRFLPKLNDWVYPDLNGRWAVEINWHGAEASGKKIAFAIVKQSLTSFSIDLETDESTSETLIVAPYKHSKSSRPGLYYIYRSEGKTGSVQEQVSHTGAALLRVGLDSKDEMHGNYFTDRSTNGQYTMRRIII
jgi:hypothetical protein